MNLTQFRVPILLISALLFNFSSIAQNLVVTLTNSNTETFPISSIQSIKFENSSMIMNDMDGTQTSWDIDDIDNYGFQETTSINDGIEVSPDDIGIFPNPASDHLTIAFKSQKSGNVTIDIIDANGKQIQQVYRGNRLGEFQFTWNPSVQAGTYYCRIITNYKMVTKPLVIL